MALKFGFSALSMSAAVDQQTGSLSVFDVLDELRAPQIPFSLQNLVISLSVERAASIGAVSGKLFIHIVTPDGQQQLLGQGDMSMPSEQHRMKAVFRFTGFPVMAWGKHRFVLSWVNEQGQKQAESILPFEATQVAQPEQPTAAH